MPLPIPEASSKKVEREFYQSHPEVNPDLNNLGLLLEHFIDAIANGDFVHVHFSNEDVTPVFYSIVGNKLDELRKVFINPYNGEGFYNYELLPEVIKDIFSLLESYFAKTPISYDTEPSNVDIGHYKATFELGKETFNKFKQDFVKIINNDTN